MVDLSGTSIGEYLLERKLGEGGMGAVYLGRHQVLDQQVAVKVLNPIIATSRELRERFIQEAKIQVSLRHPNIVMVHTAITTGPHMALIMEYVEGSSLDVVIRRRGTLPVKDTIHIATQVLSALDHAHSKGVIHRDIKPSNIMIHADGTARVMDFGIAKVLGGAQLTRTGTAMGSAHYMSPEQVRGLKDIDHRTDIYSMGITLFEMLTNRLPFELDLAGHTDSDFEIKLAHVNEPPMALRDLRGDVPQWLSDGVHKALEKAPNRRHRDCRAFLEALQQDLPPQMERAETFSTPGVAPSPSVKPPPTIIEEPVQALPAAPDEEPPVTPSEMSPKRITSLAVGLGVLVALFAWGMFSGLDNGEVDNAPATAPVETGFVRIPAGSFTMGSPTGEIGRFSDETQHKVNITRPFMMQTTQVTQGQWENLMRYNPSYFKSCGPNCPVERVSWHEALAYANALSASESLARCFDCSGSGPNVTCSLKHQYDKPQDCPGYRLPTEAEWEYAARAGSTTAFHTGNITGEVTCYNMAKAGWYDGNSNETTHRVGLKQPHDWGLYDMHGNVWEWAWDWYEEDLGRREVTDPHGPYSGSGRVIRGGSWLSIAGDCRAGDRDDYGPDYRYNFLGFRLLRSL